MTKLLIILFGFITITGISGCGSTFIPDPLDPRLIRYTDDGNNAAGALVNNEIWSASAEIFSPLIRDVTTNQAGDSLVISFHGQIEERERISFNFILKDLGIIDLGDLLKLQDEKLFFGATDNIASYENRLEDTLYNANEGQIYFRSVKLVPVLDGVDEIDYMIISGTFSFNVPDQGISVTYGRFDFKIYNFTSSFFSTNTP